MSLACCRPLALLALLPGAVAAQEYTVAFGSFAPLNEEVFIADADGSNPVVLAPHPALDYNASFSTDGRYVLFTSERDGSADIYRARPDGTELTRLVDDPAFDDQAALSADGRYLAFVSTRSGNADIWVLDLQTRSARNLTAHPAGDFRPAWSPDGEWLAWSSDRDSGMPRLNFGIAPASEIYVVRRDGSELRRLTHAQGIAGSPAWSPNGAAIAYYQAPLDEVGGLVTPPQAGGTGGTTQIMALDVQSGRTEALTQGAGPKVFPRFMPDGSLVYLDRRLDGGLRYADGRSGPRGDYQHTDWTADGRRMVYHRETGGDWPPFRPVLSRSAGFRLWRTGLFPQWSPDGKTLTTNSARAGIERNAVLIMGADGSQRSVLFDDPAHSALAPVWSPAGGSIAFGLGRFFSLVIGFAPADIAVLDVQTRKLDVLTDGTRNLGFPSWSPDGERIVYRSWHEQGSALLLMNVRSKESVELLSGFGRVNFPSWQPNGRLVQFTSDRGDLNYDVYTIDVDSREIVRLTDDPGVDGHASWSPDGKWLAFSSTRQGFKDEGALHPRNPQGSGDVYVMRTDGSEVRALTDNQYEEATTGWAPLAR